MIKIFEYKFMIISIHTQVESLKDYASTLGHGIKCMVKWLYTLLGVQLVVFFLLKSYQLNSILCLACFVWCLAKQPRPRVLLINFNLEGKPLAILILHTCNTLFVNRLIIRTSKSLKPTYSYWIR